MPSSNLVVFIGNTGSDPEMRYTPNGDPVTTFSLAVNKFSKDSNEERKQKTNWFIVRTFGKLAENCNKYLSKGKLVQVTGSLDIREYIDKEGTERKVVEVIANSVIFLWKPEHSQSASGYNSSEDVPF